MESTFEAQTAENAFFKYLRKGRRLKRGISRIFQGDPSVISLEELTQYYKPTGESKLQDQDIKVSSVVGSENRGFDFTEGFYPTHYWMKNRWVTVWTLMNRGELSEPIKVISYGGLYFIRDGHHRISTARALKQQFIRAEIIKWTVPFSLNEDFSRSSLGYFKRLCEFQRHTGFFDTVPEASFDFQRDSSWHVLEKEINYWNPVWYEKHQESAPTIPVKERNRHWYYYIYQYILKHIYRESLHYMYPGWGQGDVALELIRLWNTFENPDEFTIEDMYRIFLKTTRRKRFLFLPFYLIIERCQAMRRSSAEERQLFLDMSGIRVLRPDFRLPADIGKGFWRRLHNELFRKHRLKMKRELGRSPRLQELVEDWYDNVWLPRTE